MNGETFPRKPSKSSLERAVGGEKAETNVWALCLETPRGHACGFLRLTAAGYLSSLLGFQEGGTTAEEGSPAFCRWQDTGAGPPCLLHEWLGRETSVTGSAGQATSTPGWPSWT